LQDIAAPELSRVPTAESPPHTSAARGARICRRTAALARLGCALALVAGGAMADGDTLRITGVTMGTGYSVQVVEPPPHLTRRALGDRVAAMFERIDARMSTYRPDSELSRFNRSRRAGWFGVSPETRAVVAHALALSTLTGGAFDVTVGPLVELWGFGAGPRRKTPPSAERLHAARARVGYRRLHTRRSPPALRKEHPELQVDLSGIAKGYAVDAVAEALEQLGAQRYLVELGGELRARGRNPAGHPWRIGVEAPLAGERRVQRVLAVERGAVATSGDYRNFFEANGRRYGHTLDPRTGRPVRHALASATVLASSAARADALATALMVLGPEAGRALGERLGLAALLVVRGDGGDLRERRSAGLEAYLASE